MDEKGFPLSWQKVSTIATDIARRFELEGFCASRKWRKSFRRRHPELATRVAESLERTRVGAMNEELVQKYFDLLNKVKKELAELNGTEDLGNDLIYNLDESGVDQLSAMKDKVVVLKMKKTPTYIHSSSDRTHLSAAVCIAANGWRANTMYALKGKKRIQEKLALCPEGVDYIMTNKGYFDDEGFKQYIQFLVAQVPDDGKWRLLVFDGYGSHTMVPSTLDILVAHRVHAICMPSHTSQFLQPLDVACFAPVKHCFRVDLREVQFLIGVDGVGKWELPAIFEYALQQGCSINNIISGFRKWGISQGFSQTWMENNKQRFTISECLDFKKQDTYLTDAKLVEIGEKASAEFSKALESNSLPSPVDKIVRTLLQHLDPAINVARSLAPVLRSPPKANRKRKAGVALNTIGESHAAAKWVTAEKRREAIRHLSADIANLKEQQAAARKEKENKRAEDREAQQLSQSRKEAVRQLLVEHDALQQAEPLTKKAVCGFYLTYKKDIDAIIGGPIPSQKRTMITLVDKFAEHIERLMQL